MLNQALTLEDYLISSHSEEVREDAKEKFKIITKEQAHWAIKKIKKVEKRRTESRTLAKSEIEKIQLWLEQEEKDCDNARSYLDYLLRDYAERLREEDKTLKTIKLPQAKLQFRKQQERWICNEEILLDYLKKNKPEFIRTKEEVDISSLKKKMTIADRVVVDRETGEIIKGIVIEQLPDKFSISLE